MYYWKALLGSDAIKFTVYSKQESFTKNVLFIYSEVLISCKNWCAYRSASDKFVNKSW